MAQRKALKNVADGLAESFASRNNDTGGYWALGLLYSLAKKTSRDQILITLRPAPNTNQLPLLEDVTNRYSAMLDRLLAAAKVAPDAVQDASIEVKFDIDVPPPRSLSEYARGQPVSCTATLIDRNGKAHSQQIVTVCAPHSVLLESRSARAGDI
ncbi:MAG: hypothetical protein V3W41_04955 [Planctomycetota bacterium]